MSEHRVLDVREIVKACGRAVALVLASPAGLACGIERVLAPKCEVVFGLCAHLFALMPGLPGMYVRRAFYTLTLTECASQCYIGFGSFFTHRDAVVERDAYVGCYTLIGCAALRAGCLIGSQSSLLSGGTLHAWNGTDGWLPSDTTRLQRIEIGARSWIGERAVVMADVGAGAMVAAGAVVSSAVPPGVLVAGNPARFVRRPAPEHETVQHAG